MISKIHIIFSGLIIAALAGGIAYAMNNTVQQLPIREYYSKDGVSAVWDWKNPVSYSDNDIKEKAQQLYVSGINTVYVDIGANELIYKNVPNADTTNEKRNLSEKINDYIRIMNDKDIKVFAMAGNTDWSKPEQRYIPLKIQEYVFEYNKSFDNKFVGIEFDIESYNQATFADSSFTEKGIVLGEFADTVNELVSKQKAYIDTSQDQLELGFAIPYWYDNSNENIRSISWNDKTGPILFHVLDTLNQLPKSNVVVMSYRDAATGNDGIIYLSRTEIEYAQSRAPNVKVIIGAEAGDVEPEKITFFGQTKVEISNEFKIVHDEFVRSGVYGGIAINDLDTYLSLE